MLDAIVRVCFSCIDSLEDFSTGTRYNSEVTRVANDWVALARSRLPIGKHAHIIPFEGVIQQLHSKVLEYTILVSIDATRHRTHVSCIWVSYEPIMAPVALIEGKLSNFSRVWIRQLGLAIYHLDDEGGSSLLLSPIERSAADCYFNWWHFSILLINLNSEEIYN